MKKAGIREIKAHLSRYLQDVKKGEEVIITDRGRAIAHIVPVGSSTEKGELYESLSRMSEGGLVRLPERWGKPSGRPLRQKVKGSPVSDAVIEDRR